MQTMLVARFLDGLAGSAFLSVAGGTVGDMFAKHVSLPHFFCTFYSNLVQFWRCFLTRVSDTQELSAPMMLYTASPFVGPEIGPLIGGFIVENTTWRW